MADDPVAVILDGPISRELGRDPRGLEDTPVRGSLADWVAAIQGHGPPQAPRARKTALTAILGVWGGGLAESEAIGSPVTHERDPRRGRSTPGFGLPAKDLDILAVNDRATETGVGALSMAYRLAMAAWPVCAI